MVYRARSAVPGSSPADYVDVSACGAPAARRGPHVYFSVGHAQVNTAALHPMSVSLLHELFTFGDAVTHAAGRVYIDLTPVLHNRLLRVVIPEVLDGLSSGVKAELRQATERPGFASPRPGASIQWSSLFPVFGIVRGALRQLLRHDLDQARLEYEAALAARSGAWQAAFAQAVLTQATTPLSNCLEDERSVNRVTFMLP